MEVNKKNPLLKKTDIQCFCTVNQKNATSKRKKLKAIKVEAPKNKDNYFLFRILQRFLHK